jgi:hypothetical protein
MFSCSCAGAQIGYAEEVGIDYEYQIACQVSLLRCDLFFFFFSLFACAQCVLGYLYLMKLLLIAIVTLIAEFSALLWLIDGIVNK